ncbi:MAG: CRTAC1 family protein [Myxococcota bacterium]
MVRDRAWWRRCGLEAMVLAVSFIGTGCTSGNDAAGGDGGAAGGEGGGAGGLPEPVCVDGGTAWAVGAAPAFRDDTADRGLEGVAGTRINAVDFDGDGWTDLVVRNGRPQADDFSVAPACCDRGDCASSDPNATCPRRRTWLLRNVGGGRFVDVTAESGIMQPRAGDATGATGRPGSVFAFGDVDNDGDLDAYVGLGPDPDEPTDETSELLLNRGDGTFELGPEASALRVAPADGAPAGAVFTDVDRNGFLDLFVPQNTLGSTPQQDRLYWSDGSGVYQDITAVAGMTTERWNALEDLNEGRAHTVAWSGAACDLNGDGFPELLAGSYGRSPNHLWQATGVPGQVTFLNRGVASGFAFDARTDWSDNESARCHCQLNPDDEGCAGVPAPTLIACNGPSDVFRWRHDRDRNAYRLGGNTGAVVCADVDNDGDMDVLTTEIVHWDVGTSSDPSELLFNVGEGEIRFERPGNEATGLVRPRTITAWNDGDITAAVFDFDNDGWPDIYIGSTDYPEAEGLLYRQSAPGAFTRVDAVDGIDHHRSHGVATADFDRDGDLDVVVGHSRARCSGASDCYDTQQIRFFENVMPAGNWMQIHLQGAPELGSNAAAIGARVTVVGDDGTTQTQEVAGGYGHFGAQQPLVLHFGLGSACRAQVIVRWPNANLDEQRFDVVSGYRYVLRQSETVRVAPR